MKLYKYYKYKFLTPRDRILSARSEDGISWTREKGIRSEFGGSSTCGNAFYCFAHQPDDLDGMWEIFFHGSRNENDQWNTNIYRTISKDGRDWDNDIVQVFANPSSDSTLTQFRAPFVMKFGNIWRLFFSAKGKDGLVKVYSAISAERTKWEIEPGSRISPELIDDYSRNYNAITGTSDTSIVNLANGTYRMYFSIYKPDVTEQEILSAVSDNGYDWKIEPGARIANGVDGYKLVANNPCVTEINGKLTMYFRGSNHMPIWDKIYRAESEDGLLWIVQGTALTPDPNCSVERHEVAHPFVCSTPDGGYRMYYTGCCGTITDDLAFSYYRSFYKKKQIKISKH